MDIFKKAIIFILSFLLTNCVMPSSLPGIVTTGVNLTAIPSSENPSPIAKTVSTSTPSEASFKIRPTPFVIIEYDLQPGTPSAIPNFAHPESGCNWMGVGGQIFDTEGKPKVNIIVKLTGALEGKDIDYVALSGGAINLGSGGYEFKLADRPLETVGVFQITIMDDEGEPISQPFSFDTYNSCDKNFILMNFTQVFRIQNGLKLFLPVTMAGGK